MRFFKLFIQNCSFFQMVSHILCDFSAFCCFLFLFSLFLPKIIFILFVKLYLYFKVHFIAIFYHFLPFCVCSAFFEGIFKPVLLKIYKIYWQTDFQNVIMVWIYNKSKKKSRKIKGSALFYGKNSIILQPEGRSWKNNVLRKYFGAGGQ